MGENELHITWVLQTVLAPPASQGRSVRRVTPCNNEFILRKYLLLLTNNTYTFVNTKPIIEILSGTMLVPRFIALDSFNTGLHKRVHSQYVSIYLSEFHILDRKRKHGFYRVDKLWQQAIIFNKKNFLAKACI